MKCPRCGCSHFTVHFVEIDQRISGELNERAVFCINTLTDAALKEPYEPLLHTRITCQDCGESFVKNPDEWLKDACARHIRTLQG